MLWLSAGPLPSLLYIFAWIFPHKGQDTPVSCLTIAQDLVSLTECLDRFTVLPDYYDAETYANAQPTEEQRQSWKSVIHSLLDVDGNCSSLVVPPSLENIYSIKPFAPVGSSRTYCVLLENSVDCNGFPRGWGHVIVPATREGVSRPLHVSAPHPKYDLGTVEQSTSLFELSGAKSLLLAGRTRTAFSEPSMCIVRRRSVQPFYRTDPVHNNFEPFFDAFVEIYEWQVKQPGGCSPASCIFIQMHGKGVSTCQYDQIFLSVGLSNNPWYTRSTDYPAKRLKRTLQSTFPKWNVSLPPDSNCLLTASTNIGGRYINGVPEARVCSSPAVPAKVTGQFIHIEQASVSRGSDVYEEWAASLRKTFLPVCAAGAVVNPLTSMCEKGEGKPKEDGGEALERKMYTEKAS